jgi:hypothetical protein
MQALSWAVIVFTLPLSSSFGIQTHFNACQTPYPSSTLCAESKSKSSTDYFSTTEEATKLKDDLIALADKTRRGFNASRTERKQMKQIVNELSSYSPTKEPAAAYYGEEVVGSGSTLSGKWTLIYTDAPDITSLEGGPLSKMPMYSI